MREREREMMMLTMIQDEKKSKGKNSISFLRNPKRNSLNIFHNLTKLLFISFFKKNQINLLEKANVCVRLMQAGAESLIHKIILSTKTTDLSLSVVSSFTNSMKEHIPASIWMGIIQKGEYIIVFININI